jgi:hypothetical protein
MNGRMEGVIESTHKRAASYDDSIDTEASTRGGGLGTGGLSTVGIVLVSQEPRALQIAALRMETTALDQRASILPTSAQPSRLCRSQTSSGCCVAVQLSSSVRITTTEKHGPFAVW